MEVDAIRAFGAQPKDLYQWYELAASTRPRHANCVVLAARRFVVEYTLFCNQFPEIKVEAKTYDELVTAFWLEMYFGREVARNDDALEGMIRRPLISSQSSVHSLVLKTPSLNGDVLKYEGKWQSDTFLPFYKELSDNAWKLVKSGKISNIDFHRYFNNFNFFCTQSKGVLDPCNKVKGLLPSPILSLQHSHSCDEIRTCNGSFDTIHWTDWNDDTEAIQGEVDWDLPTITTMANVIFASERLNQKRQRNFYLLPFLMSSRKGGHHERQHCFQQSSIAILQEMKDQQGRDGQPASAFGVLLWNSCYWTFNVTKKSPQESFSLHVEHPQSDRQDSKAMLTAMKRKLLPLLNAIKFVWKMERLPPNYLHLFPNPLVQEGSSAVGGAIALLHLMEDLCGNESIARFHSDRKVSQEHKHGFFKEMHNKLTMLVAMGSSQIGAIATDLRPTRKRCPMVKGAPTKFKKPKKSKFIEPRKKPIEYPPLSYFLSPAHLSKELDATRMEEPMTSSSPSAQAPGVCEAEEFYSSAPAHLRKELDATRIKEPMTSSCQSAQAPGECEAGTLDDDGMASPSCGAAGTFEGYTESGQVAHRITDLEEMQVLFRDVLKRYEEEKADEEKSNPFYCCAPAEDGGPSGERKGEGICEDEGIGDDAAADGGPGDEWGKVHEDGGSDWALEKYEYESEEDDAREGHEDEGQREAEDDFSAPPTRTGPSLPAEDAFDDRADSGQLAQALEANASQKAGDWEADEAPQSFLGWVWRWTSWVSHGRQKTPPPLPSSVPSYFQNQASTWAVHPKPTRLFGESEFIHYFSDNPDVMRRLLMSYHNSNDIESLLTRPRFDHLKQCSDSTVKAWFFEIFHHKNFGWHEEHGLRLLVPHGDIYDVDILLENAQEGAQRDADSMKQLVSNLRPMREHAQKAKQSLLKYFTQTQGSVYLELIERHFGALPTLSNDGDPINAEFTPGSYKKLFEEAKAFITPDGLVGEIGCSYNKMSFVMNAMIGCRALGFEVSELRVRRGALAASKVLSAASADACVALMCINVMDLPSYRDMTALYMFDEAFEPTLLYKCYNLAALNPGIKHIILFKPSKQSRWHAYLNQLGFAVVKKVDNLTKLGSKESNTAYIYQRVSNTISLEGQHLCLYRSLEEAERKDRLAKKWDIVSPSSSREQLLQHHARLEADLDALAQQAKKDRRNSSSRFTAIPCCSFMLRKCFRPCGKCDRHFETREDQLQFIESNIHGTGVATLCFIEKGAFVVHLCPAPPLSNDLKCYFNHSHFPNAYVVMWTDGDGSQRASVRTSMAIGANEEIFLDYESIMGDACRVLRIPCTPGHGGLLNGVSPPGCNCWSCMDARATKKILLLCMRFGATGNRDPKQLATENTFGPGLARDTHRCELIETQGDLHNDKVEVYTCNSQTADASTRQDRHIEANLGHQDCINAISNCLADGAKGPKFVFKEIVLDHWYDPGSYLVERLTNAFFSKTLCGLAKLLEPGGTIDLPLSSQFSAAIEEVIDDIQKAYRISFLGKQSMLKNRLYAATSNLSMNEQQDFRKTFKKNVQDQSRGLGRMNQTCKKLRLLWQQRTNPIHDGKDVNDYHFIRLVKK